MKKYISVIMILCLVFTLTTACSDKGAAPNEGGSSGSSEDQSAQEGAKSSAVDLDLSELSSTMVYAGVYNVLTNYKKYVGKTIKIKGTYGSYYFKETARTQHYILVVDETSCCNLGFELIWKGNHNYPEDYPDEGAEIELTGVFGTREENGQVYGGLTVDKIIILCAKKCIIDCDIPCN